MQVHSPEYLRISSIVRNLALELLHNINTRLDENFNPETGIAEIELKSEPKLEFKRFIRAEFGRAGWNCAFESRDGKYLCIITDRNAPRKLEP